VKKVKSPSPQPPLGELKKKKVIILKS
jgi:hypothetical protein